MGSSHMEGFQVPQDKTTTAVLNKLLNAAKDVYNIGISGHSFPVVAGNLPVAIKRYAPEYVIIETGSIQFDLQTLTDIMTPDMELVIPESNTGGIVSLLKNSFIKRVPYIRLFSYQIVTFINNATAKNVSTKSAGHQDALISDDYLRVINMVMQHLHQISVDNSSKLLIFYHPHLTLNKDGSTSVNTDNEYLNAFKTACINNDIYFIDMTDIFMEQYQTSHILPYGFSNTAVGAGHLNKNGHRIIAHELFRRINEIEQGSSI
jgi:hypothetical protein